MARPKKVDKKPVEKLKSKTTAKRRKDKEEDHDDLEEFEEKPEKKLKVEGGKKGKAKIYILGYNRMQSDCASAEVHTFNSLALALAFRKRFIKKLERNEDEDESEEENREENEDEDDVGGGSGITYFDKKFQTTCLQWDLPRLYLEHYN